MSWFNIPDYVDYAHFHRMARKCSIHGDTIHFGYSMNWGQQVFGTNLIDFSGILCTELRASIMETANQTQERFYGFFGWDKFLRLPLPTNPINTTSTGLESLHYKKWCQYFFDIARREGPCQVAKWEHCMGSPLSATGHSTASFTWTYDPEIHFPVLSPF